MEVLVGPALEHGPPPVPPTLEEMACARFSHASLFGSSYLHRPVPSTVALHAQSAAWAANLCTQMGLDPNTGLRVPGSLPGQAWLSNENAGCPVYVVPDDQPLVPFRHWLDPNYTATYQRDLNDAVARRGGLPVPPNAVPDFSSDRYVNVVQPSRNFAASLYYAMTDQHAMSTISLSGSPTAGGLVLQANMWEAERNGYLTYVCQSSVPFNATAAQVNTAFASALAGTIKFASTKAVVTGGPFPAEMQIRWPYAMPNRVVTLSVASSTLNAGAAVISNVPSGPLGRMNGGGLLDPASKHQGTYRNRYDALDHVVENAHWGGPATSIDHMAGIFSVEDLQEAIAANGDLGHALTMVVAHAQATPVGFVWPATRGDGDQYSSPGYIAEGARLIFPASADFSRVPPEWMPVARTIQKYGVIIIDKTGAGCSLRMREYVRPSLSRNAVSWPQVLSLYTNPATAGSAANTYMTSLPWHQARVIDPAFSL